MRVRGRGESPKMDCENPLAWRMTILSLSAPHTWRHTHVLVYQRVLKKPEPTIKFRERSHDCTGRSLTVCGGSRSEGVTADCSSLLLDWKRSCHLEAQQQQCRRIRLVRPWRLSAARGKRLMVIELSSTKTAHICGQSTARVRACYRENADTTSPLFSRNTTRPSRTLECCSPNTPPPGHYRSILPEDTTAEKR